MDYSRPGTPTDNPFIESFNESFRDECLNTHWFLSLDDAYKKINDWVNDYNHYRPHSSLNELIPAEYVQYYQNKMIDGEILPEAAVMKLCLSRQRKVVELIKKTYLHHQYKSVHQ